MKLEHCPYVSLDLPCPQVLDKWSGDQHIAVLIGPLLVVMVSSAPCRLGPVPYHACSQLQSTLGLTGE